MNKKTNKATIQKKIDKVKWRHRIKLGENIFTPGRADSQATLETIDLPENLTGKSVLDIGCSDGFFSFECERRGAKRVVAVDDFSSLLISKNQGFSIAKELLGSKVTLIEKDFLKTSPEELGQFDIVLFLGVLYHLRYPQLAIDKLASFCHEMVVIESLITPSLADYLPLPNMSRYLSSLSSKPTKISKYSRSWLYRALRSRIAAIIAPKLSLISHDQIYFDPGIYWVPTTSCLVGMLETAGLCNIKVLHQKNSRAVIHAYHHRYSNEAKRLINQYPRKLIRKHLHRTTGKRGPRERLVSSLNALRIDQFARLRQSLWNQDATKHHE